MRADRAQRGSLARTPQGGVPGVGVVGHVEWVTFAPVRELPAEGSIVHAAEPHFDDAAGGGAVAAVQIARAAGACTFLTAVGDDVYGRLAHARLREHGVDVHASVRAGQRRAFTHLSPGERTITILGPRLVPEAARDRSLPWASLGALDGVYFTGGDVGALRAARAARVLVATPRALATIEAAGVELDVLVASASDAGEAFALERLDPRPRFVVLTEGARGGSWLRTADGATGRWAAVAPDAPAVDAYGCGDSFAAGTTCALAAGVGIEGAVAVGARWGAMCLTGRGPYGRRLPPERERVP